MKAVLFASSIFLAATPAVAQWVFQGQESAFGDGGTHLAITALPGGYAFGLRCKDGKTEAIYMTPDTSFNADTYAVANATKPVLKIRVDSEPVIDLVGEIFDTEGKAGIIADIDEALIRSVHGAKKRIAVVLTLLGENYHEKSFNVRGSTRAIDSLAGSCGFNW